MTAGSSRLTPEQANWYERRYGIRASVVPDRPPVFIDPATGKTVVRANRKQRRAQRRLK